MGTLFKSDTVVTPAASIVAAQGFIWPVAGATAVAWLGTPIASAKRNRASFASPDFTVVGTPVENAAYLGLQGGGVNYLQTELPDTEALTVVAIVRSLDTFVDASTRPAIFGNYNSADNTLGNGVILAIGASGNANITATYENAGAPVSVGTPALPGTPANFQVLAGVINPGTGQNFYNLTAGTSQVRVETRARRLVARTHRIGSIYGGNAGSLQLAFLGVVPTALTLAQITAAMIVPRRYMLEVQGITC